MTTATTPSLFDLPPEITEARARAHGFAEKYVRPVAAEYDEREAMPWAVSEEAAKVGLPLAPRRAGPAPAAVTTCA
ncbi:MULTISPECIES: acyl-CoA dehydrogenase family protein [Streptomyces]|uniref:acyl-CoA dehydrogenase family protein n=1 Tax=Streptomyces TaxID=1883 RepID=UPI0036A61C96